jgi:UDPglucose 6-dehydrogenase
MKITIFGTGYVGLVTAGCLVQKGHEVLCYDNNSEKIIQLNKGNVPIFEPGLDDLIENGFKSGSLLFTSSSKNIVQGTDIIIVCVGTPDDGTGATNLEAIESCALTISELANHSVPILIKSTVPVGTCSKIQTLINNKLNDRRVNIKLTVASNPEFLHEGVAIREFYNPDRIVLGSNDENVIETTYEMYKDVMPQNNRILVMSPESSELTKYASNSFLATKISYINQLSKFASLMGANIDDVRKGMGPDSDISPGYLFAGCGFGGSCLPKDINSLIHQGKEKGRDFSILKAVREVNEEQKKYLFSLASDLFNNDLKDKKVAIWGLSFKPKTDDMRGAPSLVIIESFLAAGAIVNCYDPIVSFSENEFEIKNKFLSIKQDLYEATQDADCLIICTEWSDFKKIDYKKLGGLMKRKLILDGRNILIANEVLLNDFEYFDIGRVRLTQLNKITTKI